jgi:hypothetical protein
MTHTSMLPFFAIACLAAVAGGQDKGIPGVDPSTAVGKMQQQFLMQFDVNKDGRLDAQEQMMAQEAMRRNGMNLGIAPGGFPGADQFVKQFDRDRDGKLSPQESAMAQAAFQRMRNGAGGVRSGGGGASGALPQQPIQPVAPPAEKKSKGNPIVKRFDKDGDGKLNADEKAAAQAKFKKEKEKDKGKDAEKEKAKNKEPDEKKKDKKDS